MVKASPVHCPSELSIVKTMPSMKTCSTCEQQKPYSEFWKRANSTDGYNNICKHCYSIKQQRNRKRRATTTTGKVRPPKPGNSLTERHPELLPEWSEKNTVTADCISYGSEHVAWWVCDKNHEWQAKVATRHAGNGKCPVCHPKFVDALTARPELAEWVTGLPSEQQHIVSSQLRDITIKSNNQVFLHCPTCDHEFTVRLRDFKFTCPKCVIRHNSLATKASPELLTQWDAEKNTVQPDEVTYNSAKTVWWRCEKQHSWSTPVYQRMNRHTECPQCSASNYSSYGENTLYKWVREMLPESIEVVQHERKLIHPYELDLYIPEQRLAIEFNGVYWHSEAQGKDKHYHRNKWLACQEKGVQLIQIWEDEFMRNPTQVKSMLAHKLGVSNTGKVFARKTVVTPLSKAVAEAFLNEHHIQGYASGSTYLGLTRKDTDELVAVLALKKEPGTESTLNIIRYATSQSVTGGFTKLLTYVEQTRHPEAFITFSDHCVSDGKLYENNGFIADKEIRPDYMYVVQGERQHKFGYRLKRFRNDPTLKYEEGLTERELAQLNNLPRAWDAGKTRWKKDNT